MGGPDGHWTEEEGKGGVLLPKQAAQKFSSQGPPFFLETALPRAAPAPHIQSQPGHNHLFSLSSSLSGITDASRVLHVCLSTGLLGFTPITPASDSWINVPLERPTAVFIFWMTPDWFCFKMSFKHVYQTVQHLSIPGHKNFNPEKAYYTKILF